MSLDLKSKSPQINLKGDVEPVYEFEGFRLDTEHLMLSKIDGEELPLTPKQVETLLALIEHHGEIVSKDALMTRLWPNAFVEESNLIQNIHVLRKVLGEAADGRPMIETLRRRGYRFNGELRKSGTVAAFRYSDETTAEVFEFPTVIVDTVRTDEKTSVDQTARSEVRSIRSLGLRRGGKFVLRGAIMVFLYLVLFEILRILSVSYSEYHNTPPVERPEPIANSLGNLLKLLVIPTLILAFFGAGYVLFGICRSVYALFEIERRKANIVFVERIFAIVIMLIIACIAIPNLITSYQQALSANQQRLSIK